MKTWAENLHEYYSNLKPLKNLPQNIEWLYPQKDEEVMRVMKIFLDAYFNDTKKRKLILGINPGRFGAGVTGVNFTAPKQLTEICKIKHSFKAQSELSAEFIYAMIDAYGGAKKFYQHFFIGSVCPLGFVKDRKNINYYDDKNLLSAVEPFIIKSIQQQLEFLVDRSVCYCIGGEKNFHYLSALNEKHNWFKKIIPLPHPRFIMQYRRKQLPQFIQLYVDALKKK